MTLLQSHVVKEIATWIKIAHSSTIYNWMIQKTLIWQFQRLRHMPISEVRQLYYACVCNAYRKKT